MNGKGVSVTLRRLGSLQSVWVALKGLAGNRHSRFTVVGRARKHLAKTEADLVTLREFVVQPLFHHS
jgi:hypothetical protein